MNNLFAYDLFVSYSTSNKEIAQHVVSRIEKRGIKCFIAPRDIPSGEDYASQIVKAISNSLAALLIFSEASNKSGYVLREVNSAVSRNKTIVPLRIENFLPSEAMEFYLGPTHWLDAYPQVLDAHLDRIISIVDGLKAKCVKTPDVKTFAVVGPQLLEVSDLSKIGYDFTKMTMREIEIDYLCIPQTKFLMNTDVEGTFDDWISTASSYEEDTSVLLVKEDEVMGYCDFYPLKDDAYAEVISGRQIVRDSMIDLYCLGGEFNAYIAMIAIDPSIANPKTFALFFVWIARRLEKWASEDIVIKNIGISVYCDMLDKFADKFGFHYIGLNPAKGKIFETDAQSFLNNPATIALLSKNS